MMLDSAIRSTGDVPTTADSVSPILSATALQAAKTLVSGRLVDPLRKRYVADAGGFGSLDSDSSVPVLLLDAVPR
jgi:hypothetical protein